MASNAFGRLFKYTTWGVSHGPCLGVVIDGCPPDVELSVDLFEHALLKRRPGLQAYTSPRQESDQPKIVSGVLNGVSTGDPISVVIDNDDVDSSHYTASQTCYRPGHADYTYHQKYGVYDPRGGGRASARETVGRVIAGVVAARILERWGVKVQAYVRGVGALEVPVIWEHSTFQSLPTHQWHPDPAVQAQFEHELAQVAESGDTVGGSVGFGVINCPVGWGDPVYEKLSARLAYALMSIPAAKAFALGEGFNAHAARGRTHNDAMQPTSEAPGLFKTNHAGGLLGGISTGEVIEGYVVFKPISSVTGMQATVSHSGEAVQYTRPLTARHDPCAVIRAVPVVEAMVKCVLADAALMHQAFSDPTGVNH